jgi:MSHA biogenesis protein MshJ
VSLWWRDLLDRIDAFSLRERVLVLLAALFLIALLWDSVLMRPVDRSRTRMEPEVKALRAEVERLDHAITELADQRGGDPNAALAAQVRQERSGIADLDRQLGGLTSGLIAPEQMVKVLDQVLDRTRPLKLVALRTLPAEPLASLVPGEVLPSQIFRHGVEIELDGTYLDLLAYLRALDQLQWRFYWQTLELDVADHPRLRVKLTAYTLGEEEAWIGV